MAAMVECEIMKQIYSGLTAKQLSTSWLEIFSYREKHIGKCKIMYLELYKLNLYWQIGTIPKMVKVMTAAILDKQQQHQQRKNIKVAQGI